MRIPTDWLHEYVPSDLPVRQLADTLTDVGLEVEAVEDVAGGPVLDIKVTPNRGDCLSLLGVARELAMALRTQVVRPAVTIVESGPPVETLAAVKIEDPEGCPRYSCRVVRGVRIAPSPEWAQRRLERCGMRPINNVVDATNLVMIELGQPLHAFDLRLLSARPGDERAHIIVRRARSGERVLTIEGQERELTPEVLVIADPSGPVALAGIMGGAATEIHAGTTDVLLESAHFDPGLIRRGARTLEMSTEASYRFERTVDPGGTVAALARACQLIAEFCPEPPEVARGVVDACPGELGEIEIELRPSRANALLDLRLSAQEIAECLRRLELKVRGSDPLVVHIPTFRQDLKTEVDLIEEVARARGYHTIPETLPATAAGVGRLSPELAFARELRQIMRGLGLSEALTSSLEAPEDLARLRLPEGHPLAEPVRLSNAKTNDRSQLRTTLLTSLLSVVATNRRHGVGDIALFDIGRVYRPRKGDLPEQPEHLGIAGSGVRWRGRWALSPARVGWDFYALKGIVEAIVEAVTDRPEEFVADYHPALHPARSARLRVEGEEIGYLGEISPEVREALELPDPVYVAELDLGPLRRLADARQLSYRTVSRFPQVTRDVALLLPREVPAARALAVVRGAAGPELERLELFDAYEGPPLPEGQRNLAFSLTFRRADRTLTDAEVETAMDSVRARLREELGALIRE